MRKLIRESLAGQERRMRRGGVYTPPRARLMKKQDDQLSPCHPIVLYIIKLEKRNQSTQVPVERSREDRHSNRRSESKYSTQSSSLRHV